MGEKILPPIKGLTDAIIKHLKPQETRYDVADKINKGLRIRVGTTGKKSFVWFYNNPDTNKLNMLTLGRYGGVDNQLTLSAARKALEKAKNKQVAGELNTNITLHIPKTVSELCDVFYRDRILPHLRRPDAVLHVIDHGIKPIIGNKNLPTLNLGFIRTLKPHNALYNSPWTCCIYFVTILIYDLVDKIHYSAIMYCFQVVHSTEQHSLDVNLLFGFKSKR